MGVTPILFASPGLHVYLFAEVTVKACETFDLVVPANSSPKDIEEMNVKDENLNL